MSWVIPNVTATSTIMSAANISSNGMFGIALMISLYVFSYVVLSSKFNGLDSILTTSVFMAIISVILYGIGGIDSQFVSISVGIMLISFALSFLEGRK